MTSIPLVRVHDRGNDGDRAELDAAPEAWQPLAAAAAATGDITLLCSSRDTVHNNAVVWRDYLLARADGVS